MTPSSLVCSLDNFVLYFMLSAERQPNITLLALEPLKRKDYIIMPLETRAYLPDPTYRRGRISSGLPRLPDISLDLTFFLGQIIPGLLCVKYR